MGKEPKEVTERKAMEKETAEKEAVQKEVAERVNYSPLTHYIR